MQWNKIRGPFEIRITAVKDQVRAGIISKQYLSEAAAPKSGGTGTFQASHHLRDKLLIAGGVAAGACAQSGSSRPSLASLLPLTIRCGLSPVSPEICFSGSPPATTLSRLPGPEPTDSRKQIPHSWSSTRRDKCSLGLRRIPTSFI